ARAEVMHRLTQAAHAFGEGKAHCVGVKPELGVDVGDEQTERTYGRDAKWPREQDAAHVVAEGRLLRVPIAVDYVDPVAELVLDFLRLRPFGQRRGLIEAIPVQ